LIDWFNSVFTGCASFFVFFLLTWFLAKKNISPTHPSRWIFYRCAVCYWSVAALLLLYDVTSKSSFDNISVSEKHSLLSTDSDLGTGGVHPRTGSGHRSKFYAIFVHKVESRVSSNFPKFVLKI